MNRSTPIRMIRMGSAPASGAANGALAVGLVGRVQGIGPPEQQMT